MQNVENLFLEVTRAIDEQNLSEAKNLLEEILAIDPGYGRAHDHLGWIYETKIKDFDQAKMHYELALKFCRKTYPFTYVNYAYLLIDYGHFERAMEIIEEGHTVQGIDRAVLFYQTGKINEHQMNFLKAFQFYKKAEKASVSKDFLQFIQNEQIRLKSKLNFWQKLQIRLQKI